MDYSTNMTEEVATAISIISQHMFLIWYGLNSVLGTLGNILVILCILTSKKLQTFTNYFVMNLSIADTLVCGMCMPIEMYFFAHRQDAEYREEQKYLNLCFVIGMLIVGLCSVSIVSLAWISFNRYLLIVKGSATYHKVFNKQFVPLMIVCSWLLGSSALIPPFFGIGGFGYNKRKGICDFDHSSSSNYEKYVIIVFIGLPLTITFMCYVQIFLTVRNSRLRVAQHNTIVDRREERRKKDLKLTKDLSVIFGVFCFCVLPYTIAELIDHEYHILKIEFHLFASILLASNSTWNPFLYAWRNKDFRNAMKRVMSLKTFLPWKSDEASTQSTNM